MGAVWTPAAAAAAALVQQHVHHGHGPFYGRCWTRTGATQLRDSNYWLLGALLAEAGALIHTIGTVLLRKRARKVGHKVEATKKSLWLDPNAWFCILLRLLAYLTFWGARCFAPDSTVAPIYLTVSLLANMACAPAILHEQYYRQEVIATLVCIFAVVVAAVSDFSVLNYLPDRRILVPTETCFNKEITNNMILYTALWCIVCLIGFFMYARDKKSKSRASPRMGRPKRKRGECIRPPFHPRHAVIVPVMLGLLEGAMHFVSYVGLPWCSILTYWHIRNSSVFVIPLFIVLLLAIPQTYFTFEGAWHYDCRFFIPVYTTVSFVSGALMRSMLSTSQRSAPSRDAYACLVAAQVLLVVGPFFNSSVPSSIKLPRTLMKADTAEPTRAPPDLPETRRGTVEYLPLVVTPILEPLLEVDGGKVSGGAPDPERAPPTLRLSAPKKTSKKLAWFFARWVEVGRAMPLCLLLLVPIICILVKTHQSLHVLLGVVAALTAWAVCGSGVHMAVFSGIGRWRLQLCMETNYLDLCKDQHGKKRHAKKRGFGGGGRLVVVSDPYDTGSSSSEEEADIEWQSVRHFVLVEGDADPGELHGLLTSIASSPLAKEQIGVVLAEEGAYGAAAADRGRGRGGGSRGAIARYRSVVNDFKKAFKWLLFAPVSLTPEAGMDTAGSGSGTGVAQAGSPLAGYIGGSDTDIPRSSMAAFVLHYAKQNPEVRAHLAIFTHTTADAVFHPEYFTALTFAFLAAGKVRSSTIWQPPVLQLKDYYEQGVVMRQVSLFQAQEQLATLTDPFSVPLPQSTYSAPLSLERIISRCWEPSFYRPLQHCGVWSKCWLTTIGRSSVQPIFLPVVRRGEARHAWQRRPRGSCMLWPREQVRANSARYVLELSYAWCSMLLAFVGRTGHHSRPVSWGRLLCLLIRSFPPLAAIAWTHIVLSIWFWAMLLNLAVLLYVWMTVPQYKYPTGKGVFLLGVTSEVFGLVILAVLIPPHVALVELLHEKGGHFAQRPRPRQGHSISLLRVPLGQDPTTARPLGGPIRHTLRLGLQGVVAGPLFLLGASFEAWTAAIQMVTPPARINAGSRRGSA